MVKGEESRGQQNLLHVKEMDRQRATPGVGDSHPRMYTIYVYFPLEVPASDICETNT